MSRRMRVQSIQGGGIIGIAILAAFVLSALLLPHILPGDPNAISDSLLEPPERAHLLGTDDLGRDILLQLISGVWVSFSVGISAALATSLLGTIIGSTAGFNGGTVDLVLMRITEMFQVIPTFVLAAVIVAMWGPGLTRIILVIALLAWPQVALVIRAEVIRIKKLDFVDAVRCLGYGNTYILIREIIPNAIRPVLALGTLAVGQAILLETALSFLGLSDPSLISWGRMLNTGQNYLLTAWWIAVFPGLAIFLIVLACNFVGDSIGAYLNPAEKGR
jgi:peptide/nickel transport system permease protein